MPVRTIVPYNAHLKGEVLVMIIKNDNSML